MFLLSFFFPGAHDLWVNLKEVVLSVLLFSEKSANPRLKFVWWRICLLWKKRWGTTSFSKAFVEWQASDTWKSFGRNSGTMKEGRERERECVCIQGSCFCSWTFCIEFYGRDDDKQVIYHKSPMNLQFSDMKLLSLQVCDCLCCHQV